MALPDPLVVELASVDTDFPRVSSGDYKATYRRPDGSAEAVISHAFGKRNRTSVRLNSKKFAADPFVPAVNVELGASVTLVIDRPKAGYSNAELSGQIASLVDFLTRDSGVLLTQVLGGES